MAEVEASMAVEAAVSTVAEVAAIAWAEARIAVDLAVELAAVSVVPAAATVVDLAAVSMALAAVLAEDVITVDVLADSAKATGRAAARAPMGAGTMVRDASALME